MLTLYNPTSDSEGKVIRQIKAESGASTTNRKGGACPFPRQAGMGDIVGGAFGRQGWSGEPCPVVPPGPQYCRYWSLEASQGEACPWLGWRPAFRSWPLASWPLWSFHSCWQSHRTPSASVHITAIASTFKKEEKERKRQREEVRGRKEDRKEGSGKGKRERALSGKNRSLSL